MPACPNCGYQVTGGALYCPVCGQPLPFPPPAPKPSRARTQPTLPLGHYMKIGWELFKQYPYGFISFCLLNLGLHAVLQAIPVLGSLASGAVGPPLIMGNFIVAAKLLQRHTPQFRDFFAGIFCFWPLVLVSLLGSLLITIGMMLLILPGIYLTVAYLFSSCLVIDRRLDFWPALELSRRTVTPLWLGFFAFLLLLMVINLAGALLLGLGLLATIPLSFCALTAAYGDIFGFQSDYSGEVPRLKTLR